MFKLAAPAAFAALALGAGFLGSVVATPADALQLRAPGPQPGDCKASPVVAHGSSPAAAQAVWSNQAIAQHGANWGIWAGAQGKVTQPTGQRGATAWQAMARPCFFYPVQ
ncbi:hypothetical protein [Salinarimonas sp.]|uniref:hypothetical protein n=1 Tax=Salinarimonas sp. TaxID=2766526 RepID=UPI0032D918F4